MPEVELEGGSLKGCAVAGCCARVEKPWPEWSRQISANGGRSFLMSSPVGSRALPLGETVLLRAGTAGKLYLGSQDGLYRANRFAMKHFWG